MLADRRRDLRQRVEGTGVHVAGLGARRSSARRSPARVARRASGRIRPCSSAATRWTRPRPRPSIWSETKTVTWASSPTHDVDRRRPEQARAPRRPSRASRRTAWRAAARAVKLAIVAPVVNPHDVPGRQAEQLDQPACCDLLGDRRGRREHVQAGVLVPGAREPVGRQGRRLAAADDEPEVARPGAGDDAPIGVRGPAPRRPASGSSPSAGSGPPIAARRAARSTGPPTGRSSRSARNGRPGPPSAATGPRGPSDPPFARRHRIGGSMTCPSSNVEFAAGPRPRPATTLPPGGPGPVPARWPGGPA